MTTALTTRVTAGTGATVKGTPLTNAEIDANFLSLNNNKLETSSINNNSIQGSLTSLGIGTTAPATTGEIRATNAITSYYSDERLKENIEIIENALDKVQQLRGVTYTANELAESFGYSGKETQVGVLAADVQKVLPQAVKPAPFDISVDNGVEISKSGMNFLTVQYERIVPLLIEAIKELNKEITDLKSKGQ